MNFVTALHDLLAETAEDPRDLIHSPRREGLRAAWAEVERRGVFQALREALQNPEFDEALATQGLTGAELRVKLSGFYYWIEQRERQRVRRHGGRRARRWFRRALSWADVLLGSLSAIPWLGAPAAAAIEIKDTFLQSAEDRELR